MKTIAAETLSIIRQSHCYGDYIELPDQQLDRKLYQSVNKVFADLGGKWDRKTKAHRFEEEVR